MTSFKFGKANQGKLDLICSTKSSLLEVDNSLGFNHAEAIKMPSLEKRINGKKPEVLIAAFVMRKPTEIIIFL